MFRTLESLRGSGPFCLCADSHPVPIAFSSERGNLNLGCAVLCPTGQGPRSPTLGGAGLFLLLFSRPPSCPVAPRTLGGLKADSSQARAPKDPGPPRCAYSINTVRTILRQGTGTTFANHTLIVVAIPPVREVSEIPVGQEQLAYGAPSFEQTLAGHQPPLPRPYPARRRPQMGRSSCLRARTCPGCPWDVLAMYGGLSGG
jgi:hypothetical protein